MNKAIAIISAILVFSGTADAWTGAGVPEEHKSSSTHVYLKSRLSFTSAGSDAYVNGEFLRLSAEGRFADDFSYIVRQRLNKAPKDGNFLDATDYLYLKWTRNDWEISGGKYYIACGDYEYLSSTYDMYMKPLFYDGLVGMYTFLADVSRLVGTERLKFQISNSIYAPGITDLAGISFDVDGRAGLWEHNWSINAFEREKGRWNGFQCFGNIFHLNSLDIFVNLTHRIDMEHPTLFKDFSSCVKFRYSPAGWVNILGKVSWDYKDAGIEDPMLPDGTDHWLVGGGCEFFPIRNYRKLRLHCYGWGDRGVFHSVTGISWQIDVIND